MLYACVCVYIADNRQLINTQLIPTAYGAEKKRKITLWDLEFRIQISQIFLMSLFFNNYLEHGYTYGSNVCAAKIIRSYRK